MRVSILFRIIVIAVAALVVSLYAILQFQDFSQYRGLTEEQAHAALKKTALTPTASALPPESTRQQPAPGEGFGKDLEGLMGGLSEGLKGLFN
jgi:hypothetical protein